MGIVARTVGAAMRRARQRRGLTIKELSAAAGVSYNTICLNETGRHLPDLYNLIVLADALGVTLDEYVGRVCNG